MAYPDGGDDQPNRKRRQSILKMYYEFGEPREGDSKNPRDIDSPQFNPELYLTSLMKEKSLTELMDTEREVYKQIQSLDSDMQTLVYENYNKFISATDTIRKMKNDFKKMEDEMDLLATNMATITDFSARVNDTLQDRREQITKFTGVHTLLKKLQFLFELPTRLKKCIEVEAYGQAVRYYVRAHKVLLQYQHMPSFNGIQQDCNVIVAELNDKLRQQFRKKDASAKQLAESVDLLLQLKEPAEQLCEEFLSHARQRLDDDLGELEKQVRLRSGQDAIKPIASVEHPADAFSSLPMDILEFVDYGCNKFLSNMCLVIASYHDMFLNRHREETEEGEDIDTIAVKKLVNFVMSLMSQYFQYVEERVKMEKETGDNTILVRALDRFHRRLQAMNKLLPDTDFSRNGTDIVTRAGLDRCQYYVQALKQHFSDCLTDIRQNLVAPKIGHEESGKGLSDMIQNAIASITEQIKGVLGNLQVFIRSDITFAMKPFFREPFCKQFVREGLVVAFFKHVNSVALDFCESVSEKSSVPPGLLLVLSRICHDLGSSTISYVVNLTDDHFLLEDKTRLTSTALLSAETKDVAQKLLNHYVKVQGLIISQMLRKSTETRDWLNTIEPRNVRPVMKRVVEDVTAIDGQVGQLYEEGVKKERSSDSSRHTLSYSASRQPNRSTWSNYAPSTIDNSLMSNIQKLFSERIEIFTTVEFSKVSVVTGIIKISLKTFLECVRLRTFGRYGLQQTQVDIHYLQLYLWRFVSDENLVHVLLDEIMGSAVHRCIDPLMMESSVVEVICEKG